MEEKADFEKISDLASSGKTLGVISAVLIIIFFISFLSVLNPHLLSSLIKRTGALKAWVVLALGLLISVIFFALLSRTAYQSMYSYSLNLIDPSSPRFMSNIFFIILFGLLWVIIGEMGFGGDFSSWGSGKATEKGKPAVSFVLGLLVGFAVMGILTLNEWVFNNYLHLISEVLDRSGEVSYLGFILLRNSLIFMLGLSFAIIAGIISACAPVYRSSKSGLYIMLFPLILILIMFFTVKVQHSNAVKRYDWGKLNLSSALNIPSTGHEIKTVVLFLDDEEANLSIKKWVLESEIYGTFIGRNTIAANYDNLRKVEKYLIDRQGETIFNNVCREIIHNGYYVLWDVERAHEKQAEYAYDLFLPRMMFLTKLKRLPVTEKNFKYLKEFSNREVFYAGGRSALRISEVYIHFGQFDEARKWLEIFKASADKTEEDLLIPETILTDGVITGCFLLNGEPLSSIKVGLFNNYGSTDLTGFRIASNLLDTRITDTSGRFKFENIGTGEYFLGIMTDKELIPYSISPENITVSPLPNVLKLDLENPAIDLKDIDIILKQ
ncbi:MAG TPA: hypothetical protein ENN73_00440 [Firmicutes bacterium]|nr:hypothetical protein [Bacillota bacterium]